MASQPIPPSSCTLFFSWRNSLPEVFYAYVPGGFSLLLHSVLGRGIACAVTRCGLFCATIRSDRSGAAAAKHRNFFSCSNVVQRRAGPRGTARASLPRTNAPYASLGRDLSAESQDRPQRERFRGER